MKYTDLLLKDKKEQENALAPARAQEMKAKVNLESTKLDLEIQGHVNALEILKSGYPLDLDTIRDKMDDVDLLKREKSQLDALSSELFDL